MRHKNIKTKLQQSLKDPYILALIILVIVGVILRFYNFTAFVTYLGDQGRDTIVLKRIVTLEDFPGIGASSSVGNLFLGPFYYYFIAPWLLLTNFNPVGPALGVAFFSTLLIPAIYFAAADLFNKKVAIMAALMITFSFSMVWMSRFSWNPNLLPLFSLLAIYAFIKGLQTKKWWQFFIAGICVSISTQLHYVSLALGAPMGLLMIHYIYVNRAQIKSSLLNLGAMIAGFVLFQAPLIIFELKNNFLNTRGFIDLIVNPRGESLAFIPETLYTLNEFHFHAFQYRLIDIMSAIILIALVAGLIFLKDKKQRNIRLMSFFFILLLGFTAVFTENKNRHYFGAMYPIYYMIVAYVVGTYLWKRKAAIVIVFLVIGFVLLQHDLSRLFVKGGAHQIRRAEHISKTIFNEIQGETLQITSLPDHYGDYMYRYYLEVWGKTPVERAGLVKADELYVVCQEPCQPIGDPQWDIAYFEPIEIVKQWDVEDVTIYKLIRSENSPK